MIPDIISVQLHPYFFKAPFRFTKKLQIIHQIFSHKIWQLLCHYFYQNSGKTHIKNLGLHKDFLLQILNFILVSEICFHVTVVIDTKPKVKGELQTVIENLANS